jgi:glycosyltransferase involved in cell wall biosynthesis
MRLLMISGVDISSSRPPHSHTNPRPDFLEIQDRFSPDVIDIQTVAASKDALPTLIRSSLGSPWAVAWAAFRKAQSYDGIMATGEDVGFPLAFFLKLFRVRIPLIVTCHNITSRRPRFFLDTLRVGSAVTSFQCLSRSQAAMLSKYAGVTAEQVQMLYWHVDDEFFQPMPEARQRAQICSAGMASRDYATLIAAAETLDVDLKIAADSPWFKQSLNITEGSLSPRVEVRSYGNYFALRQLYAESRVVVVPLLDVPFSAGYTVILEGMAMSKPVIVTRIKQYDDFVVDGWNGFYVPPGDADALRSRLNFLLENPSEAARLGANARKSVEERFALRHFVERMDIALQQAFASAGRGRKAN